MKYMMWIDVEKQPENEAEWEGNEPSHREVADIMNERLVGKDFDTGWIITGVNG